MPATGRRDYDALFQFRSIPADEPRFLLRAQDLAGADAVRAWADIARKVGTPPASIELALQQADAMEAWPVKKAAAVDGLDDEERLQLEYQLRRRGWDWQRQARAHTEGEALAFALGRGDAFGETRHVRGLLRALIGLLEIQDDRELSPDELRSLEETLELSREAVKPRGQTISVPSVFSVEPAHGLNSKFPPPVAAKDEASVTPGPAPQAIPAAGPTAATVTAPQPPPAFPIAPAPAAATPEGSNSHDQLSELRRTDVVDAPAKGPVQLADWIREAQP